MGDINMCEKFRSLIDGYIDNTLTDEEMAFMKAHANECLRCAEEMKLSDIIKNEVMGLDDDIVVPLKAQSAWRNAVRKEIRNRKFKKVYKALSSAAAALIVLVGATFIMRSSGALPPKVTEDETQNAPAIYTMTMATDSSEFDAMPETAVQLRAKAAQEAYVLETDGETDEVILAAGEGENIIKSCDIVTKSESVDEDIKAIYDLAEEYEGYVSEFVRDYLDAGDHATIVSRIPTDLMDDYISAAENIGEIVSVSRFSQNADEIYYDIDSRLEAKKALAQELNALIENADENSVLILNEEINTVFAEIDALTRLQNTRDNDLMYAKCKITLLGVEPAPVTPSESTLATRSAQGFKQSLDAITDFLKDMVVSLAVIAPAAILIAAVTLIVLFTAKRVKKNKNDKKEDGDE